MNFHFRGQSVSVTATLVLWAKTAYCWLWWMSEIFHFAFCILSCVHTGLESVCTATVMDYFARPQRREHFSLSNTSTHTHTSTDIHHLFARTKDQRAKDRDAHTHRERTHVLLRGLGRRGDYINRFVRLSCAEMCVLTKSWGATHTVPLPSSLSVPPRAFPSTVLDADFFILWVKHLYASGKMWSVQI